MKVKQISKVNSSLNGELQKKNALKAKSGNKKKLLKKNAKNHEEEEADAVADEEITDEVQNVIAAEDSQTENDNDDDGDGDGDDDDDDDDDNDDDNDDDDSSENESSSDEEADDAPLPSKGRNNNVLSINTGNVPKSMNDNQVLVVKNLPKKFKQIDVIEVFGKYGEIDTIKPVKNGNFLYIAYKSAKSATAALAANKKEMIKGQLLTVRMRKPKIKKETAAQEKAEALEKYNETIQNNENTVYVKNLKKDTTEAQIKQHYQKFGQIETVQLTYKQFNNYAFITFVEKKDAIVAAKETHNTNLNGATIFAYIKYTRDPKRTIILLKKNSTENKLTVQEVKDIFAKCGEIEHIDIICKKSVLAFVVFEQEKSIKKALKLCGSTVNGIVLEVQKFVPPLERNKTMIFVQNVKQGITTDEIKEFFKSCGRIESVHVNGRTASVKFIEKDAFCKSFLLNETKLGGQLIFISPYSTIKDAVLKKANKVFKSNLGKRSISTTHNALHVMKKSKK